MAHSKNTPPILSTILICVLFSIIPLPVKSQEASYLYSLALLRNRINKRHQQEMSAMEKQQSAIEEVTKQTNLYLTSLNNIYDCYLKTLKTFEAASGVLATAKEANQLYEDITTIVDLYNKYGMTVTALGPYDFDLYLTRMQQAAYRRAMYSYYHEALVIMQETSTIPTLKMNYEESLDYIRLIAEEARSLMFGIRNTISRYTDIIAINYRNEKLLQWDLQTWTDPNEYHYTVTYKDIQ